MLHVEDVGLAAPDLELRGDDAPDMTLEAVKLQAEAVAAAVAVCHLQSHPSREAANVTPERLQVLKSAAACAFVCARTAEHRPESQEGDEPEADPQPDVRIVAVTAKNAQSPNGNTEQGSGNQDDDPTFSGRMERKALCQRVQTKRNSAENTRKAFHAVCDASDC